MAMEITGKSCVDGKEKLEVAVYKVAFTLEMNSDASDLEEKEEKDLQSAFLTFKKKRIHELKMDNSYNSIPRPRALDEKLELRNKFLSKLFTYIGTPYAKRFHKPGCVLYDRKLYLDCCGLIRRVVRDLSYDFGFEIGRWNQAYMWDTLPIKISDTDTMKPGDLVFISATYFDQKRKRQIHDMVHVEVWLGDDVKTIGSRWYKGTVQVFDSYKFVSKAYYNMKYHFCSIETWLDGVCRSFCPEHKWLRRRYQSKKHSIFRYEDLHEAETSQQENDSFTNL